MTDSFDPRVTPVRDDLVATHLRDRYPRANQASGQLRRATVSRATLSFGPDAAARRESELLFGEGFTVFDERDGWAWGQAARDHYVGWLPSDMLGPDLGAPTHEVVVPATYLYPEADLKSPAPVRLSLASLVVATGRREDNFLEAAGGGWIHVNHVAPREVVESDYVSTGLSLVGVPYLWGGRSSDGMDCSGFIQVVLQRAGLMPPRDSDQQEAVVGTPFDNDDDLGKLRRDDILFFQGHVGIVLDGWRFLHASASNMTVSIQRLSNVVDHAKEAGTPPRAVRRIWPEHERRTRSHR